LVGRHLDSWSGHKRSVEDLIITPSGEHVYSCSSDSTVKKWDRATGEELASFVGHQTSVYSMFGLFDDDSLWSGNALFY
jgi:WD40 repeat protein